MRQLASLVVLALVLAAYGPPAGAQSKKAADLIKKLADKSPTARQTAAEELGELAQIKIADAKAALPALAIALKDPDPAVRRAVILALGQIEPEKFPALLVETLKTEKDGLVLIGSANALAQLGPDAKATLPALYEIYKTSPRDPPKAAKTKDPPPPNPMPTDPPAIRRALLAAIARIEPDVKARLPFLIDALKPEKEPGVQQPLIAALGQIGPPAKAAVPVLLEIQKESLAAAAKIGPKDNRELDPQGVRRSILAALVRIEPDVKEKVPVLVDALKNDRDGQVRSQAIGLLVQLGPMARTAVPVLMEVHKSIPGPADPQGLRRAIVAALGRLEPDAKEAVPLYTELLMRERDPGARLAAVQAVGTLGPQAKSAFGVLAEVLKSSPPQPKLADPQGIRRAVVEAMSKIEPDAKDFVPLLTSTLRQDRDPAVKRAAVAALAQLGPDAKAAVPTLTDLTKQVKTNDDKTLAKEAAAALEKIGK